MKSKRIKWIVKWKMPYRNESKVSIYDVSAPKGISKMWYWWLAEGKKGSFKMFCFFKRFTKPH